MPQLRITKKFADDLNLSKLQPPETVSSIFDDWVIDVVYVFRKKVAIATHVESKLTFLLPYSKIGGAKHIPTALKSALIGYLDENRFSYLNNEVDRLFGENIVYTKTDNRSVLSNMKDFKNYISGLNELSHFDQIDWDKQNRFMHNIIINAQNFTEKYVSPSEIILSLLNKHRK